MRWKKADNIRQAPSPSGRQKTGLRDRMPDGSHAARRCGFDDAPGCFAFVIAALRSRSVTHPDQDVSCWVVPAPRPCSRPWPLPAAPEKLRYQTVSNWRLPAPMSRRRQQRQNQGFSATRGLGTTPKGLAVWASPSPVAPEGAGKTSGSNRGPIKFVAGCQPFFWLPCSGQL